MVSLVDLMMYLLGVMAVLCTAFYLFLRKRYKYWEERGVPGPMPRLLFGNMWKVFSLEMTEAQLIESFYDKYSQEKFIGIYNLWNPALLVRDLELVKKVCVTNFVHFMDHPQASSNHGTDGVLASLFFLKGEKWRSRRKILLHTLTPRRLKEYSLDFKKSLNKLLHDIHELQGQEANLVNLFGRSSAYSLTASFYGIDLSGEDALTDKFVGLAKVFSDPTPDTVLKFLFYNVAPSLHRILGLTTFPSSLWDFYSELTKKLLASRYEKDSRNDLITLLNKLMKEGISEYEKMNFNETVAHVAVWFLASYHTSLMAMCHTVLKISLYPDVQKKVLKELQNTLPSDRLFPNYEDLGKMVYLESVIKETMRMEPLLGVLKRTCTKEYPLSEKYNIPVGMDVYIPASSLHRESTYFPDPHEFRPERFIEDNAGNQVAFMPFGKGPRTCAGVRYAEMMMKLLLSVVLREFEVEVGSKMTLPMVYDPRTLFITNRPEGGIWVKLKPRNLRGRLAQDEL